MHTSKSRITNGILLLWLTRAAVAANFDILVCKKSKVCVAHPVNCLEGSVGGCEYAFSYAITEENPKRYDMEMYTRRPDPLFNYVAVGFSDDQEMGNDTVLHCASVDGQPMEVHLSHNLPGNYNKLAGPGVDKAALTLAAAESDENHIYCKFSLTYDASVQQNLPDPAAQCHLLFARGPAATPQLIGIHGTEFGDPKYPVSTDYKVDLLRQPISASSGAVENATGGQDVVTPTVSSDDPEGGPSSLKDSKRRLFDRFNGMGLFDHIFYPHHRHVHHDRHHDDRRDHYHRTNITIITNIVITGTD